MSWESSIEYYRIINQSIRDRLGGVHSAKSLMYSVDFAERFELLQHQAAGKKATAMMVDAARRLERGRADFVVICTNNHAPHGRGRAKTPSRFSLHIADATAELCPRRRHEDVGLLGTRFTMEQDFYRGGWS
jgi:aspartate racemase